MVGQEGLTECHESQVMNSKAPSIIEIHEALNIIERSEMVFISQGIVDAGLTKVEIQELLTTQPNATVLLTELQNRKLVLESGGLYRSRMAETVRLMRTLKQSFREQSVTSGKSLVLDFRFVQKSRQRPRLDTTQDDLLEAVGQRSTEAIFALKTLSFTRMRHFQVKATLEVLSALDDGGRRGVVITAGTGSGKSLAFYLPAITMICDLMVSDSSNWTKVLAIYPRNELLKDQFASVFRETYNLSQVSSHRPISLGAWFGPTPKSSFGDVWETKSGVDAVFPLSDCPKSGCGGALYWRAVDRNRGVERLECGNCKVVIDDEFLRFSRDSIQQNPPDILFTTTESLNRQLADSKSHRAFGINPDNPLRLVLLDETHTYEGSTGAQNAYLFRRFAHAVRRPLIWVGLSATLANPREFMAQLTGLSEGAIEIVQPELDELEPYGGEYLLMLRHDPISQTSPLAVTIQAAMLMSRALDTSGSSIRERPPVSGGIFGQKIFLFTDKLDVTNRLFWNLLDAEGWSSPKFPSTLQPKSLAFLRTTKQDEMKSQFREPVSIRDPDGQHWWIAEQIGHLTSGHGKRIGRVSSQVKTNVDDANIVIATSTLEVGVSDDTVGAVVQHKAPGSAARFVQRKGRAGRQIEMRPWTVMTVSEWGRDKLAWQMFDQTLDPQVTARNLPLHNRHILKIQAVYSTLDWLSLRLIGSSDRVSSSWTDLSGPARMLYEKSGPAQVAQIQRQVEAARLLRDVLAFGPEYSDWRSHVQRALGLSDEDVNVLLVSPPRPLLLGALTTMHRRLTTEWEGEIPAEVQIKYRNPIPDFVPGSLFADLLTKEVPVSVPVASTKSLVQSSDEFFPVVRILRDFLPGNISRHFGREKGDRHWVPIPIPTPATRVDEKFDPRSVYRTVQIGSVVTPTGELVPLHLPTNLTLSLVQSSQTQLSDGSSMSPIWNSEITNVGEGKVVPVDQIVGSQLLNVVTAHLHNRGDALRIRRFVLKGSGRMMGRTFGSHPAVVTFSADESPLALGFEYESDGIVFQVCEIAKRDLKHSEKLDFVFEAFQDSVRIPDHISYFERVKLARLCEAIAIKFHPDFNGSVSEITDDRMKSKIQEAVLSLDKIGIGILVDDDEHLMNGTDELLDDPLVMVEFSHLVAVLLGGPTSNSNQWLQRRFATTLGAAVIETTSRLAPNVDTESLQLDIAQDGLSFKLSELEPGGNGNLEELVEEMVHEVEMMGQILRSQSAMGEIEGLGYLLEQIVRALQGDPSLRQICVSIINGWSDGHSIISPLFEQLEMGLRKLGILLTPSVMTALTSRFVGPGCPIEALDLAVGFFNFENSLIAKLGFIPELSVVQWLAVEEMESSFVSLYPNMLKPEERRREIEQRSWPRGRNAAKFDLVARGQFERLPTTDRYLLTEALGRTLTLINLDSTDIEKISEALLDSGEVEVVASVEDRTRIRDLIVRMQANPLEVRGLFVYPKVIGITSVNGQVRVRFAVEEGVEWNV
jgi:hypothetical protein